jgi:HAAS
MWPDKPVEPVHVYLAEVAAELRALPAAEVEEIVRELHSHVLGRLGGDRDQASVTAILERLGDPRAIAHEYLEARSGERDVERSGPDATDAFTGRLVGWAGATMRVLGSVLAYGFAACWLFTALAKPFHPARVGLWLLPDASGDLNLSLGSHAAGETGRDLLGWWIVPLGLALSAALASVTWRWNCRLIRRWRSGRSTRTAAAA